MSIATTTDAAPIEVTVSSGRRDICPGTSGTDLLRPYQRRARHDTDADTSGDGLIVVMPTGSGKSFVIADQCRRIADGHRVAVITHVMELVAQPTDRPPLPIGEELLRRLERHRLPDSIEDIEDGKKRPMPEPPDDGADRR